MARPKSDTEAMNLRLSREILDALDDIRREEKDLPNRQEMVRRILIEAIEKWTDQRKT
jgi:metal-responsive CopG/Arc/MetJ family transcriptional regulator